MGSFSYYWADDHINVASDVDTNCEAIEQSLRLDVITVLGHDAVNEETFTSWRSHQQVLSLIFDTVAGTVAMPDRKSHKAPDCVQRVLAAHHLNRANYRSLLGRLRHVATCVHPTRPFLERLCQHDLLLRRWQRVPMSDDMKQDLIWWSNILGSPLLNGVPLDCFHACPEPDVVVEWMHLIPQSVLSFKRIVSYCDMASRTRREALFRLRSSIHILVSISITVSSCLVRLLYEPGILKPAPLCCSAAACPVPN